VVRLLECTNIRVGNDEYARANGSYGLTTLRDKHVEVSGGSLRFSFKGKSGKTHEVELSDRRLAWIVRRCRDVPGEELFQYLDDEGKRQTIDSGDVNDYLREISGQEFTAKDFRTWAGTMLAVAALRELGPMSTEREAKSAIVQAIDRVAGQLNNTRAVCRKYYIHPTVFETYLAGTMLAGLGNGSRAAAAAAGATTAPVPTVGTPQPGETRATGTAPDSSEPFPWSIVIFAAVALGLLVTLGVLARRRLSAGDNDEQG